MEQRYQFQKQIGKGAYGQVFLALNLQENKTYAIKRVKFEGIKDNQRQTIQNQIRVLQKLKHPNLVPFKESFMDSQGFLNIVLSLCQGGDLYSMTSKTGGKYFAQGQVLDWLCQVCLGLHYMHENRILHRDLKPQNIFIKDRRVLLGDFGISKILQSAIDLTSTCVGTPYYMSPDLYKYRKYSYKADIWALGCVIYEICNLQLPFNANSVNALSLKVIKGTYEAVVSFYSKPLRDLIKKMLSLDAKVRPSVVQILNISFVKPRVHVYFNDLLKKAETGQINSKQIYLDELRIQLQKLYSSNQQVPKSREGITRVSSASTLKARNEKQKKIVSQMRKQEEDIVYLQRKLSSLDKRTNRQRRSSSKKRKSQFNRSADRSSQDRRKRKYSEQCEQHQVHRSEPPVQRPVLVLQQSKGMEQDEMDYQPCEQQNKIYRIQELAQQEEEERMSIIKDILSSQLKQKTMKIHQLAKQLGDIRNQKEEEEIPVIIEALNPAWVNLEDRISYLKTRCMNLIGKEKMELSEKLIWEGKADEIRNSMIRELGQQNIGVWHLLDSIKFYTRLQQTLPRTV